MAFAKRIVEKQRQPIAQENKLAFFRSTRVEVRKPFQVEAKLKCGTEDSFGIGVRLISN